MNIHLRHQILEKIKNEKLKSKESFDAALQKMYRQAQMINYERNSMDDQEMDLLLPYKVLTQIRRDFELAKYDPEPKNDVIERSSIKEDK